MLYTINFLVFKLFKAKKNNENALHLFVLFSFPPPDQGKRRRSLLCRAGPARRQGGKAARRQGGKAKGVAASPVLDLSNDPYILWNFACV